MYRGRFAPSPTGRLHFGSLVAALASFLDARANEGKWLVRIEDLDPPREIPGAADDILRTLETFNLFWDEKVIWQSQRNRLYHERLQQLARQQHTYACNCTRKRIRDIGGHYDNRCRGQQLNANDNSFAIRAHMSRVESTFTDRVMDRVVASEALLSEDFIIKRKDSLYAYQFAVVVDDIEQGITHVVRGVDLLESTFWQMQLYHYFNASIPHFAHIPLAVSTTGRKLSKQNYAPAIDRSKVSRALNHALRFLGHTPPQEYSRASAQEILDWAIKRWQIDKIPKVKEQIVDAV